MAGDWLKMECCTPEKAEVLAITAKLGWDDVDLTVGKLFRMWRWFDQHTVGGNAKSVTPALLEKIIGTPGFCDALQSVGWLVVNQEGISLPNFDAHNGNSAKSRAETARRVSKHKAKKASDDGAQSEVADDARALIPRPIRRAVLERHDSTCVYCGRRDGEYVPPETARDAAMHIDHVIPVSQGGSNDPMNLVCACGVCNMFKSGRTPEECGLAWPMDPSGKRFGNAKSVTSPLPREEKRREDTSAPDGAGGEPPADEPELSDRDRIFAYGVPMLVNAGTTDKAARSFLAGKCRDHGDAAVVQALRDCYREHPVEPLMWLAKRLPMKSGKPSAHSGFDKVDYRKGINDDGSFE